MNNGKTAIDVHVHLAALPDGRNDCYISPKMMNSMLFRFFMRSMGLDPTKPTETNEAYLQQLRVKLAASRYVSKVVLLGMDGVYGADGKLDKERTEFLITNDYVLATAKRYPKEFLPGVSINPMRRDAVNEFERCADAGAALVKVLPNSQQFDPADSRFIPLWQAMARRKIPLLSHVGYEFSLLGEDQSVGDPARLRNALETGVTVIAAHGASFGLVFYEKYWKIFTQFVRDYPNFYWDASALSLPNRAGMLLRIARHPELHSRMVFGTDYPLSSNAFPVLLAGKVSAYQELRRISNPFDRHFRLLEILGLPASKSVIPGGVNDN